MMAPDLTESGQPRVRWIETLNRHDALSLDLVGTLLHNLNGCLYFIAREGYLKIVPFKLKGYLKLRPSCMY